MLLIRSLLYLSNMQKHSILPLAISIFLIAGGVFMLLHTSPASGPTQTESHTQNVVLSDGVQYVTILAKGGYSPSVTNVSASMPTKIIVKTDNTYDCSASLVIPAVGLRKVLPPTGEEVIDVGVLEAGAVVRGACGMGMYTFSLNVLTN